MSFQEAQNAEHATAGKAGDAGYTLSVLSFKQQMLKFKPYQACISEAHCRMKLVKGSGQRYWPSIIFSRLSIFICPFLFSFQYRGNEGAKCPGHKSLAVTESYSPVPIMVVLSLSLIHDCFFFLRICCVCREGTEHNSILHIVTSLKPKKGRWLNVIFAVIFTKH